MVLELSGESLELREIKISPLRDKTSFAGLENKVTSGELTFRAAICNLRAVIPEKGYPPPGNYDSFPSNYFEMGLFGWLGVYVLDTDGKMITSTELPRERLAHVHYSTGKAIRLDFGNDQYRRLKNELPASRKELFNRLEMGRLFSPMRDDLHKIAQKVLLPKY